ncbi:unnamed protein product [Arctogadus glacialis]
MMLCDCHRTKRSRSDASVMACEQMVDCDGPEYKGDLLLVLLRGSTEVEARLHPGLHRRRLHALMASVTCDGVGLVGSAVPPTLPYLSPTGGGGGAHVRWHTSALGNVLSW